MISGDESRLECFHELLERRVEAWLAGEESKTVPGAPLYRHLPRLFVFLTRAALDPRVPGPERRGVLSALKYVIAPYDLIPEGVVGTSGFRDDLVLTALVVDRLLHKIDPGVASDLWGAADDPGAIAAQVLAAGDAMVGPAICEELRTWFESHAPADV